jgi:hypothetical protein
MVVIKSLSNGAIALRKYIASQFKPSVAKFIYNTFDSKHVLDISSGWGDRLAGFYASNAQSYVGIDPNTQLIDGYKQQIKLYESITRANKTVRLISQPSEEVDFSGIGMVDTIFTSPPYYNIEKYGKNSDTDSERQSWKRYRKLDNWMDGYLFTTLEKAWDRLSTGGKMIINISDVYSNHTHNKICDPMCDFIDSLPDAHYAGCFGMKLTKRPNSKAAKDGTFIEPMWVFTKGQDISLMDILTRIP